MQITLYMLNRDLEMDDPGFRESIQKYRTIANRGIEGLHDVVLRVDQSGPEPPLWQRDLLGIAEFAELRTLLNLRTGALLTFSYRDYRFVLAYGAGWHSVDPAALEPGFGLRVVANAVAADKIISADTTKMHGRRRSQRTSLASAGPLYELGIEPTEAFVRQLEGTPAANFASQAAGSDALKLRIKGFSLIHLKSKLDQIIDKFEAHDYKGQYDFLDHFRRVHRSNSGTYRVLQEILTEKIQNDPSSIDFLPPDILAPMSVENFTFEAKNRRPVQLSELTAPDIGQLISEWGLDDPLKEIKVRVYNSEGDELVSPHPLFSYVADEVTLGDQRFTLSAGQWFAIDADYLAAVSRRIGSIEDLSNTLSLPTWPSGEGEGNYNTRAARARGWACLDRKNFSFGAHQQIEVCDLLTAQKQLICVKRMTKSNTLSHLFAQGRVSAELLVSDHAKYQDSVVRSLRAVAPAASFGNREDWTIVYAIGTNKPGSISDSLFFFSKLNLDRAARTIKSFGIRVAVARIPA